jgi:protoporphyrinogen oxidase
MTVLGPAVAALLSELELTASVLPASPAARHRYVVRRGRLLPLPTTPPELLTTIPQYTLSHGRYQEIMDDVERRNPGPALTGSYREGVGVGDVITAAEQAATRVLAQIGPGEVGEAA